MITLYSNPQPLDIVVTLLIGIAAGGLISSSIFIIIIKKRWEKRWEYYNRIKNFSQIQLPQIIADPVTLSDNSIHSTIMEDSSISDKIFVERLCSDDADNIPTPPEITTPISLTLKRSSDFIMPSDLNSLNLTIMEEQQHHQRKVSERDVPLHEMYRDSILSLKRSSDFIMPSDLNSLNLSTMKEQQQHQRKVSERDVPLHEMYRDSILSLKRSSDFIMPSDLNSLNLSTLKEQQQHQRKVSERDVPLHEMYRASIISLKRSSDFIMPSDMNTSSSKEQLQRKISEESDDVPLGIRLYSLH